MKAIIVKRACLFVAFCLTSSSVGAVDFGFGLHTQRMSGHTTYHIKFTEFIPEIGSDLKGDSELEFPLDVFLVGGSARLKGKLKSGEPWSISLGVSKNVNNPSGIMKDSDWLALPQYNYSTKFSYTESDAELGALLVCVEGRLGIVRRSNFAVDLLGGYEYQDFSFEILGARGWQGFDVSERVYFDTLQGTNVLDYDVTYHLPYGGIAASLRFSPRVGLKARAAISPRASASDHDDHLLRFFTADGDCSGWALKTGAELGWMVLGDATQSHWSLGLGFGYTRISTKGTQDQTYYGDEPATPDEDETGMKITGIKEKITSSQIVIQAQIGYEF
jgi:outer membrane protease